MSFPAKRSARRLSCWLMFALLFMQLATAAHACPRQAQAPADAVAAVSHPCAAMSQADHPHDGGNGALCVTHCTDGAQAAEQGTHTASAPLAPPALIYTVDLTPDCVAVVSQGFAIAANSERAPPPPLAILHCCYRI